MRMQGIEQDDTASVTPNNRTRSTIRNSACSARPATATMTWFTIGGAPALEINHLRDPVSNSGGPADTLLRLGAGVLAEHPRRGLLRRPAVADVLGEPRAPAEQLTFDSSVPTSSIESRVS
jgi:hypothetical protein